MIEFKKIRLSLFLAVPLMLCLSCENKKGKDHSGSNLSVPRNKTNITLTEDIAPSFWSWYAEGNYYDSAATMSSWPRPASLVSMISNDQLSKSTRAKYALQTQLYLDSVFKGADARMISKLDSLSSIDVYLYYKFHSLFDISMNQTDSMYLTSMLYLQSVGNLVFDIEFAYYSNLKYKSQWSNIRRLCDSLLNANPKCNLAKQLKSDLYIKKGDIDSAIVLKTQLIGNGFNIPYNADLAISLLLKQNNPSAAKKLITEVDLDEHDPIFSLSRLYLILHDTDKAIVVCRSFLTDSINLVHMVESYLVLTDLYLHTNQLDSAAKLIAFFPMKRQDQMYRHRTFASKASLKYERLQLALTLCSNDCTGFERLFERFSSYEYSANALFYQNKGLSRLAREIQNEYHSSNCGQF